LIFEVYPVEINVLRKEKNEIEFEIVGEDSTLPGLLVHKLNGEAGVDFAAFRTEHPLMHRPRIIVRTKRGDPTTAIGKALDSLAKEVAAFRETVSKLK
jgi:DNA-directed RNA polymerase subunit L